MNDSAKIGESTLNKNDEIIIEEEEIPNLE
jgi:hypothetical protein